jgi:hypothetical protein
LHLQTAIAKGDSVSCQSSIDLFRYGCIYLHTAIVKEDSVSHQSSINAFGCCWIHLQTAIVKEDGVSRQSSIDRFRYGLIHLHPEVVKGDSISQQWCAAALIHEVWLGLIFKMQLYNSLVTFFCSSRQWSLITLILNVEIHRPHLAQKRNLLSSGQRKQDGYNH